MNASLTGACPHCGTPVEGPPGTYCCHGCELAAEILANAGLSDWYTTRQQPAPRATRADAVNWSALPTTPHGDGTCSVALAIDGLQCASCVWVAEKLLERTPGVAQAQVSYATGRARLRFDPTAVELADITSRLATLGYRPRPTDAPRQADRDLLVRAGFAAFLAANVMGLAAALYAGWMDGMDARFANMFRWLSLLLAIPSATWAAWPFHLGALRSLRAGALHLDLPLSLAILAMLIHGGVATLAGQDAYFDSLTMLVALLLIGRALEARGRRHAAEAAATLSASIPRTARRVRGGTVERVPVDALRAEDLIEIVAGEELPADGVLRTGRAEVQMSLLTGESRPVTRGPGELLVAGALVLSGSGQLEVTEAGEGTVLGRMAAGLASADDTPRTPDPADALAPWFTGLTLVVAALTFGLTTLSLGTTTGLERAVAVLVVACPCALALSGPLIGAAGVGAMARRGLLLRGVDALRRLGAVDVALLDKTGTVTQGRPRIVDAPSSTLRIAAALERSSRHPLADAILDAATEAHIPIPTSADVVERPGHGVEGVVDGRRYGLGAGGPGEVVLRDGGLSGPAIGTLRWSDTAREQARDDLASLQRHVREVRLLSGDASEVAQIIAAELDVDATGDARPEDKVAMIEAAQARGDAVLFVGDGLNDGPALGAANVGIAMGSGAASSVLVADGVLAGSRLMPLAQGVRIARITLQQMRSARVRSVAYNIVAVALAASGWINPLVAAILMPLSSAAVILSAHGVERAARTKGA